MQTYLPILATFAIVGTGVVTGLLFAFSNSVMRALADLPETHGMFAMQRVNEAIINPIFRLFFFSTPAVCVLVIASVIATPEVSGHLYLLTGVGCYVVGPFAITMFCNVPLNKKLAGVAPEDAESAWLVYQRQWQFWNHIRSYIGVLSIALLAFGATAL